MLYFHLCEKQCQIGVIQTSLQLNASINVSFSSATFPADKVQTIIRALRTHTRACLTSASLCNLDIYCWQPLTTHTRPVVYISTKHTYSPAACIFNSTVGTADGRGYNGQQKYAICDACRPCHSILSILKPVFRQIRQIHCTYMYNTLRCLL